MAEIRKLPPSVVNKIAAGEVIERPASVVKELLENSIDAGATRLEVVVDQGGMELMKVTDNGHGIAADQLPLAVTSHATSKIGTAEDLFCVGTLGFRGEALASIAEVSQMVVRSRTAEQDSGCELRVNGGQSESTAPCSCAVGTSIEVANLFFNTPVRRKFLRTTQTEMGHITEAFARIALARPELHAVLIHNGRTVHDLSPTHHWAQRVADFFGSDIANSLIPITSQEGPIRISGFVVDPSHSRGNNRMQFLFLNGRYIRDRALQHALGEAYRGLLMTGRFPMAFLQMDMPPELVDVNVHPAKLEVRFQEGGRLYSQLLAAIRNKFLTTDLTARAPLGMPAEAAAATGDPSRSVGTAGTPAPTSPVRQDTIPLQADWPVRDWTSPQQSLRPNPNAATEPAARSRDATPDPPQWPVPPGHIPSSDRIQPRQSRALQIHNRYLVSESEEGVVVIDQHALHERIIYEQLREKVLSGQLESQRLLVPEPVPLSAADAAKIIQSAELLDRLGIQVEAFGGDTVLVSAYPAMLANHNPAEMLHDVVELLTHDSRQLEARDVIDELLHMISCKAAVKAGDQLSDEEIMSLMEHRQLCQDAHHCPHGRPTALVFSREELDRRFKRI